MKNSQAFDTLVPSSGEKLNKYVSKNTIKYNCPIKSQVTDPTKLSGVVYNLKCKNCKANYTPNGFVR